MNTAILSPNGGSIGIGFAMSSAVVAPRRRPAPRLRRDPPRLARRPHPERRPRHGRRARPRRTPRARSSPTCPRGRRSTPASSRATSSSASAASRSTTPASSSASSPTPPVGETVDVVVFRDGKEETLKVTIGLLEEPTLAAAPGGGPDDQAAPEAPPEETLLGMTVAIVTDDLRRSFALDPDVRGPRGHRRRRGLRRLRQGHARRRRHHRGRPGGRRDARRRCASRIEAAEAAGRNSILLLVRREGQPRFVALNLSN